MKFIFKEKELMTKVLKTTMLTIVSITMMLIGFLTMLLPAQNSKITNGAEPTTATQQSGGGEKPSGK